MGKNLCPENEITFETSYQIRFDTPIQPGTYTCSAVIESTDVDSSACLMLFYYADSSTKEVYITRKPGERVFKTVELTKETSRVRIYASEGHTMSSGDTATYSMLQIEAGSNMTEYEPYGYEPEPEPEPEDPTDTANVSEIIIYVMALAGKLSVEKLPTPTCRCSRLLRKIADPSYEFPSWFEKKALSRSEVYLWDIINGTSESVGMIPQSDFEKYLAIKTGRTEIEKPDPNASDLNTWMNEWVNKT